MKQDLGIVGIVGLGQIGGSLAKSLMLSGRCERVLGFDVDMNLSRLAQLRRVINRSCKSAFDLIKNADIIVIALRMFAIHDFLDDMHHELANRNLVIDTGSTKQDIMKKAAKLKLRNFVGGHPYAGTEKVAPEAWDGSLLAGQVFFLVESNRCTRKSVILARRLARAVGSQPQSIQAALHDRMFALASGLPHMIAYALVDSVADEKLHRHLEPEFLAHSFRSSTRVAKSQPDTVAQFLWQNRKALSREIDVFSDKLRKLGACLSTDAIDDLSARLKDLRDIKTEWERRYG
jgi:prephenate dehydrogenase